jgi:hypothetical protein
LTTAISCGLIAFDVRYHGSTVVNAKSEWNLSLETLAQDQVDIVHGVSKHASWESRDGGWPDLILVGHRYPPPRKLRVIVVLEEQCRHILRRMGFFQRYVYVSLTW